MTAPSFTLHKTPMGVGFVYSPEQEKEKKKKSGPVRKAEGNSPGSSVSKTKGTDPVGHINGRFHGATRAARGCRYLQVMGSVITPEKVIGMANG